jgi:HD-GYP domain-containing protein (c-di-GMP phosphodiesterase class II)
MEVLMEGFKIYRAGTSIKEDVNKAGTFKLKVDDIDFEIFESEINAGRSIICQPYESQDSMNAGFVLSGKLYHMNSKSFIMPGEYYIFKNLKETHYMSVEEKTRVLVVRKKCIFKEQVSVINKITSYMDKIQQKDCYTDDHCNRTGNLAVKLAIEMGVSEKIIENILYAGKIHDVGKIRIPSEVLNKPGKLSEEEFDLIKKHPQYGYDIIMESISNKEFANIILQHHEKIDGSGYPNGLKGDQICMEAKIIAVADCYDAMTSDRPYRAALSKDTAIEELQKYAGIWYDAGVVEILTKILNTYCNKI